MNKKTTIIKITLAAVLIAGVIFSIFIFRGKSDTKGASMTNGSAPANSTTTANGSAAANDTNTTSGASDDDTAIVTEITVVSDTAAEEPHQIKYVYMPDVVGSYEEGACEKLKNIGFYNVRVEYEPNENAEVGRVHRQSIPPNATVGTDYEIVLYIAE
jgi:hypothetical protein